MVVLTQTLEKKVIGVNLGSINQTLTTFRQLKTRYINNSLYHQILGYFSNETEAQKYIQNKAGIVGITATNDLIKALEYIADIETLSLYKARYDKPRNGILDINSQITSTQMREFAGLLLKDKNVKLKRRMSETGDYYEKRFIQEKLEGRDSLYKSALSSKIVSEVGFARLVYEFGRKNALAIAQMTLGYNSIGDFIQNERDKFRKYVEENPNGKARYEEFNSGKRNAREFTVYDFISRESETPEEQSKIFHDIIRFFANAYTTQQHKARLDSVRAYEAKENRFRQQEMKSPKLQTKSSRGILSRLKAAVYSLF